MGSTHLLELLKPSSIYSYNVSDKTSSFAGSGAVDVAHGMDGKDYILSDVSTAFKGHAPMYKL
jgi:hypothetical protein